MPHETMPRGARLDDDLTSLVFQGAHELARRNLRHNGRRSAEDCRVRREWAVRILKATMHRELIECLSFSDDARQIKLVDTETVAHSSYIRGNDDVAAARKVRQRDSRGFAL